MAIEEDPPAGVPEWIVTYGDMMSLLLTFFIMLVSLSEVKGDKKYQAMVEAIMKYMGYHAAPLAPTGESFPLSGMVQKLKSLGAITPESEGRGGVKMPGPHGSDLRVFKGKEGTFISLGGPLLFEPFQASLTPAAESTLIPLAQKLAGKPNKIDIRGHTSCSPLPGGSPFSDKTSLCYERARNVMTLLEAHGITRDRIRLSMADDAEPLSSAPQAEREHLDRVEIFVLDAYAKDFVGPRDLAD